MRRAEQNLGEKRVLLGSVDRKNNLRLTYERLNLEEKAFISSTKFNRRQLLSRQTKLRQLQGREQVNKGSSLEFRMKTRISFPELTAGANESATRGYFSNSTPPYSRNGLQCAGKGNWENISLGKDSHGKRARLYSSQRHSNGLNKALDVALGDVAIEKRYETNVLSGQKGVKVEKISKSCQARDPELNVDDIIAYSTRYQRKTEKPPEKSSTHREEGVCTGNIAEKQATLRGNFPNFELYKSTETESFNTTKAAKKITQSFDKNFSNTKNRPRSNNDNGNLRSSSERIEAARKTASSENETMPRVASFKTAKVLSKDDELKELNSLSSETESRLIAITSTLEDQPDQETPRLDNDPSGVFSSECTNEQTTSNSLVSRTPSWHVTESLPALGRIRRGSFCDVKTFTSGKVLDLLSSCEIPSPEKKSSKNFLEVENENLKYCRYLRSVTPNEAAGDDYSDIPMKYRPSKNIIIGHTKVSPQLKDFQ